MKSNRPWILLSLLFFLLFHSLLSLSLSSSLYRHLLQSIPPPQNIQSSSTPPDKKSDSLKLTAAVIITAVVSFTLSTVLFLFIHRRLTDKRRKLELQILHANPMPPFRSTKFDPNLQSVLADDSRNVFYWRSIDGAASKLCYHCTSILKQSPEDKLNLPLAEKSKCQHRKDGSQEIPLLPPDIINSTSVALHAVKGTQDSPPPPPPPPPPHPLKPLPPTPPAMPAKKGPAPPPLPGAKRGGRSAVPVGFSRPPPVPDGGKNRPRLKPLHWEKVTPANAGHSMVWDKITEGSIGFDDDILESLFGYTTTNRSRPAIGTSAPGSNPFSNPLPPKIRLLDPRKSQNIAIILRTLAVGRQEILDALHDGHILPNDALEKLSRIVLTPDEESLILSFSGNPSQLTDAESFLFHILRSVTSAFARLSSLHFRSSIYEPEILLLKDSLQTLDLACDELRTRPLFLKLLEAILKAGNRMNAGTARGNAQAFDLIALRKLSDVKSTDGKTNLLHFVVEEVVRSEGKHCAAMNRSHSIRHLEEPEAHRHTREEREKEYMLLGLPIVRGLSIKFTNVNKAAAIDPEVLAGGCATLEARLADIRKLVRSWKEEEGRFVMEMTEFVEAATGEIENVKEEQGMVMEKVRRTTEYYQPGVSKDHKVPQSLQLFVIVRDFLAMVDLACVYITQNLQRKLETKSVVEENRYRQPMPQMTEASPARKGRNMARFPNLPARFMWDNSVTSSDSEEDHF